MCSCGRWFSAFLALLIFSGNAQAQSYCQNSATSSSYEWIKSVTVNQITNTSSGARYQDFTSVVFSLTRSASNSISLTPGFSGSSYPENWAVWIDYNRDGVFQSIEQVYQGSSSGVVAVTGTFSVPSTAAAGTTRLRVVMRYGGTPPECNGFQYGEVEDYLVTIPTGSGTNPPPTAQYCASQATNVSYEWIAGVRLGGFTNTIGGSAGYENFTTLVATADRGASVSFTLTPGFASTPYAESWAMWVDYNGDADFSDAGEEIFRSAQPVNAAVNGSFTIPSTAVLGKTRVRVAMSYVASQLTPCASLSYGQVEDYSLDIKDTVQSGQLDPSFGSGGKAFFALSPGFTVVKTQAQADGKILIIGVRSTVFPSSVEAYASGVISVVRLLANGALDTSFGTGGIVELGNGTLKDLAIRPSGQIVLLGATTNTLGQKSWTLFQLTSTGAFDGLFEGGGKSFLEAGDLPTSLGLQSNGKIVVAGMVQGQATTTRVIAVSELGRREARFGNGSASYFDVSSSSDLGYPLLSTQLINGQDYFLVARASSWQFGSVFVTRYNANGSKDFGFSSNGDPYMVTPDVTPNLRQLIGRPDGSVLVLLDGDVLGPTSQTLILRFLSDGRADTAFGTSGLVRLSRTSATKSKSLLVKEISSGYKLLLTMRDATAGARVTRFSSAGVLETTFPALSETTYGGFATISKSGTAVTVAGTTATSLLAVGQQGL